MHYSHFKVANSSLQESACSSAGSAAISCSVFKCNSASASSFVQATILVFNSSQAAFSLMFGISVFALATISASRFASAASSAAAVCSAFAISDAIAFCAASGEEAEAPIIADSDAATVVAGSEAATSDATAGVEAGAEAADAAGLLSHALKAKAAVNAKNKTFFFIIIFPSTKVDYSVSSG